jgi:GNAT superfamily N-acetyltransferase
MESEMQIELLADRPEAIPVIAGWYWQEWGQHNPERPYAEFLDRVSGCVYRNHIPLAYVAMDSKRSLGTASLVECDMETHPELSPWLAGVYVDPRYRHRGIASMLVRKICAKADELGFAELFLYTNSADELYRKLGWVNLEQTNYRDKPVKIMKFQL